MRLTRHICGRYTVGGIEETNHRQPPERSGVQQTRPSQRSKVCSLVQVVTVYGGRARARISLDIDQLSFGHWSVTRTVFSAGWRWRSHRPWQPPSGVFLGNAVSQEAAHSVTGLLLSFDRTTIPKHPSGCRVLWHVVGYAHCHIMKHQKYFPLSKEGPYFIIALRRSRLESCQGYQMLCAR